MRARIGEMHATCNQATPEALIGMLLYDESTGPRAGRPDDVGVRERVESVCRDLRGPAPRITRFERVTMDGRDWFVAGVELGDRPAADMPFLEVGGVVLFHDFYFE